MEKKYWLLNFQGKRSADDIQSAVGRSGGLLIRIHVEDDKTQVYFTADKFAVNDISKSLKAIKAPTLVSAKNIVKLG
jgi:hypothetical protein